VEKILSLNEEIDVLIKKKISGCKCDPCTCADQTKDVYFQELKDILARFNKEYLSLSDMRIDFLMNESHFYSIG